MAAAWLSVLDIFEVATVDVVYLCEILFELDATLELLAKKYRA